MAIAPKDVYPGTQIDTTDLVGYPQGAAQNETTPGDNTGTPLEMDWVNDQWGFHQALLAAAGLSPSGTPDKVGASQYLQAVQTVAAAIAASTVAPVASEIVDIATTGPLTKPSWVTDTTPVTVMMTGAGGGGAGGNSGTDAGGGGGGGSGLIVVARLRGINFDASETVTIGAGGAGGAGNASTPVNGAKGGTTSVTLASGQSLFAFGGGGGFRTFFAPPENPNGGAGFHGGGAAGSNGTPAGLGGEGLGGLRGGHYSEVTAGQGASGGRIEAHALSAAYFTASGYFVAAGNAGSGLFGGGSGAASGFPALVTGYTPAVNGGAAGSAGGGQAGPGPGAGGGGGAATTSGIHGAGGAGASGFFRIIWGR